MGQREVLTVHAFSVLSCLQSKLSTDRSYIIPFHDHMVSWWSNESFIFFPVAPCDGFISSRTEILGKLIFYSWSKVYISLFVFISSPCAKHGTSNFSGMRSIAFHRQVYNNNTDVAHPSPAQPFGFHLRIIRELWIVSWFCCLRRIENLWIVI